MKNIKLLWPYDLYQTEWYPKRMNFFTFWAGSSLSPYETVCLMSALNHGHQVTIFTYEELKGPLPSGIEYENAQNIVENSTFQRVSSLHGLAAFSDLFRYEGLTKQAGIWMDTDILFVNSFFPSREYVFGEEINSIVNGAILGFPPHSELALHLLELTRDRLSSERKIKWGDVGPSLLTSSISQLNLKDFVLEKSVFYPVHYSEIEQFFDPSLCQTLEENLVNSATVHLWNNVLSGIYPVKEIVPPRNSWLEKQFNFYGIDFEKSVQKSNIHLASIVRHKKAEDLLSLHRQQRDNAVQERDKVKLELVRLYRARTLIQLIPRAVISAIKRRLT